MLYTVNIYNITKKGFVHMKGDLISVQRDLDEEMLEDYLEKIEEDSTLDEEDILVDIQFQSKY